MLASWDIVCRVGSSYRSTDKEVLCGVIGEEVTEHLLQPDYQPGLQLLLHAAVFSLVLAAG